MQVGLVKQISISVHASRCNTTLLYDYVPHMCMIMIT